MPGIVARVGGRQPLATEVESVLGPLRHFDFYESKGESCRHGWLGWVGIGQADLRICSSRDQRYLVAYHGDGAAHLSQAGLQERTDRIIDLIGDHPADLGEWLGGSFAAACLDRTSGGFHCLTDRFGHHRVYYCVQDSTLYLACEVKGFLGWPELPNTPNPEALCDLINYGYPLGDRTSLAGVKLLRPASWLSFCDGRVSVKKYWRPCYQPEEGEDAELCAEGHQLFSASFATKAAAAPRWILPVSGGLDSRLLLARALADDKDMVVYTYGHARAREAAVACDLMQHLGVEPNHIQTDDYTGAVEAVQRATWFGEGMVNATIAHLAMLLGKFAGESREALYLNGIYGGPTNFSNTYHKPDELVTDLPRDQKIARIGATKFAHLLHTEQNYEKLTPDFARICDVAYDRELARLLPEYEGVSPLFGHQKDAFYLDNRLCRFMNQVDLNRYYWDEVIPLTSNGLFDFYLRLPDRLRFGRLLHKRILARFYPRAAEAVVFSTGISVTDELAGRTPIRGSGGGARRRHYLRRLTAGRYNPPEPGDFRDHDYHMRRNPGLLGYYESIFGDERLYASDFFSIEVVRRYLRRFRLGYQLAGTLATIMAWELWMRQLRARRWDV